jgi:hypothetical protein
MSGMEWIALGIATAILTTIVVTFWKISRPEWRYHERTPPHGIRASAGGH